MARLKLFATLSDDSWEVIKKIKSHRTSGLEGEECNLVNIERDYPEKIFRTYCKCGYTSGREEEECPICGNKNSKRFILNGYSKVSIETERTFEEEYMANSKGTFEECVSGYSQERYVDITSSGEFNFIETKATKEFSICSDKVDSRISSFDRYSFEEFMKLYKYPLEHFDYFRNKSSRDLDDVVHFIKFKEEFPVLMKNIHKYPNIVNHIVSKNKGIEPFKKISNWDEVYGLLKVPYKDLYPYVENLYRGDYGYNRYYYGRYVEEVNTDAFDEYKALPDEMKPIAEYMLIHGDISYNSFKSVCSSIGKISSKEADVLFYFVRNNYISLGYKVINEYVKKADFIRSEGYEVSIANMDTRNFNLIRNKKYITENQKYNEKRTMFFLEMFDMNPLDSLQYLSTRRAPNKDLRKELADKLD